MRLDASQFRVARIYLTLMSSFQFYHFIQLKIFCQQVYMLLYTSLFSPMFCYIPTFFVICHLLCKEEHSVHVSGNYVSAAQKGLEGRAP